MIKKKKIFQESLNGTERKHLKSLYSKNKNKKINPWDLKMLVVEETPNTSIPLLRFRNL